MKLILIFLTIIGSSVNFVSSHESKQPGREFYRSLPSDERLDFLIFTLGHGYAENSTRLERIATPDFRFPDALGIDPELIEKFLTLEYPENFTSNLYTWTRSRYNLDHTKMRRLILERSVCLANGDCIDINDIGGLCCPF